MAQTKDSYYVPHGSHWPVVGSVGLFLLMVGVSMWLNGSDIGSWITFAGIGVIVVMLFGWFGDVIDESEGGVYNAQVDKSFRMGMMWFIFSEVMFFAAFFGALFYARSFVLPWLDGEGNNFFTNLLLWPGFEDTWPTNGPADIGGEFQKMGALGLPLINTAILLTSSVTVTIAHHAIREGNRGMTALFLALTFLLGYVFVGLQAYEYVHAYRDLNLTLESGIYGSTFFMLTGFHGMHVTIGAIMLTVIFLRVIRGHFTAKHHFAFEATAWYWHFVDVVWLGLYIFVYWL
ncbi:cytochrome c oxidase subunit 3 [Lentisalinibacter orientalis]|uniref:cytochrome c oxidase subunit 3 n=1 Tax=Lentisalinibacter orientalis TaxID=2992241 RepID=UPI00386D17D7